MKTERKRISFRRLALETLPEIWGFQILASLAMVIPAGILTKLLNGVAELGDGALTSADLRAIFLSWRTPLLLLLGVALILLYTVVEIFAQIYMNGDVLSGERIRTWREIKKGLRPVKRFLNPTGILVLLYIFIAAPLCGLGFSVSLTESFHIPNFIMDVILATPLYFGLYAALILVLVWIGYRSIFTLHGVLLDDMSPAEARKASAAIIKKNGKRFVWGMLKTMAILALVQGAIFILFCALPDLWLARRGGELPSNYFFDVSALDGLSFSETDVAVVSYRVVCAATILVGGYLVSITSLLCGAYLMLRLTRYYLEFTGGEPELWPERPKKSRFPWKLQAMIVVFVVILLGSVAVGLFYNQIVEREEPVKIVAHRAGGTMALENSVEGLKRAIEHGCYGSEIDIQRTKDGRYVVNHDKTFKRLTGVNRAPKDMTLAEIRELRIRDTASGGATAPIATLEEMLETIKGKEKLFIELKGATADRRMVDDVVAIVRAHDCVSDAVLISLNYDIIKYAETNYPEFETGALFFMGLGDISKLKCDLLIMEEEMATESRIWQARQAGKKAVAWTVNTEKGMRDFLTSAVDAIITDEIELAEKVQAELDARADLQVMEDMLSEIWN